MIDIEQALQLTRGQEVWLYLQKNEDEYEFVRYRVSGSARCGSGQWGGSACPLSTGCTRTAPSTTTTSNGSSPPRESAVPRGHEAEHMSVPYAIAYFPNLHRDAAPPYVLRVAVGESIQVFRLTREEVQMLIRLGNDALNVGAHPLTVNDTRRRKVVP